MLLQAAAEAHEEEEQCLFFVALSRARDVLHLSRACSYNQDGKVSNPSPLLDLIAGHLPQELRGGLGAEHGTGHHQLACGR